MLAPTLVKGDIVVLNNLGSHKGQLRSHKGQAARRAIRQAGAHRLFPPPYSPDLNPIEQLFVKRKHRMRDAETRTVEATWRKLGDLLHLVSPSECANDITNAGYASVQMKRALRETRLAVLGIMENTTRTVLRRFFEKRGVARQSEMAALMVKLFVLRQQPSSKTPPS